MKRPKINEKEAKDMVALSQGYLHNAKDLVSVPNRSDVLIGNKPYQVLPCT